MVNYKKLIFFLYVVLMLAGMFLFKFEVVVPGNGIIIGESGDIDVITPDSGFIDVLNVEVGDEIKKGKILFSYNNLEVFHRYESLINIVNFLKKEKSRLDWDIKNLNILYEMSENASELEESIQQTESGTNTSRFLRKLNSLNRKIQELELTEKRNQSEMVELNKQNKLLEKYINLLERSKSPQIEILEKKREIAQIRVSRIDLEAEIFSMQSDVKNEIDTFQIRLLETINMLTEEVVRTDRELMESEEALELAKDKQNANMIISPVSGTILNINQQFTVGSYIEASQKVLTIKQSQISSLIEAKIEAKYRPFISRDASVKIVVNSPGYKKTLQGIVDSISVDSFSDENNPSSQERFYNIDVIPNELSEIESDLIGVQANIFIVSDNITVFEYITATMVDSIFFNVW